MNIIRKTGNIAVIYTAKDNAFRIVKNNAETVAIFNGQGWKGYTEALDAFKRIIYQNRRC